MTEDSKAEKSFNEAMRERNEGRILNAIQILETLTKDYPKKASFVGMLAGLHHEVGNYAKAVFNAKRAIELSHASELASRILFHASLGTGDIAGAFAEMARFRALRQSAEYDRILVEMEDSVTRDLQSRPHDDSLKDMLAHLREEMRNRPIRH
jgi:hypothetical protein